MNAKGEGTISLALMKGVSASCVKNAILLLSLFLRVRPLICRTTRINR